MASSPDPDRPAGAPRSPRRKARRARADALYAAPLDTPGRRLRAWISMLFADHGFLRAIYLNLHRVAPGVWRAAQPLPGQIDRLAARHGLRSVVTLRGGVLFGSWPLEREACARNGLALHRHVLRSRGLPSREELRDLRALLARVETPVLFHCKSGADRAGLMAALWLILQEGRPVREAAGQLSLRYGHIPAGPTGVLDRFLEAAAQAEDRGLAFMEWVEREYDRDAMLAEHRAASRSPGRRLAGWLTDRLLRRE
ncbi:MAG: tyrosine-protein phosphatase [Pseudomonadota bacterium]